MVTEEVFDAGDFVIVIGRSSGTVNATGEPYDVRLVDASELRDRKLVGLDIYLDTPAIQEKLRK